MDNSEIPDDPLPLIDDESFDEALRCRMGLPSPILNKTQDVREVAKRHKEVSYPESGLERHHPRLVAKLVLLWGYPECGSFLDSLIIDWRGDRDGFKREVMEELLFLNALSPRIARPTLPWQEREHLR